MRIALPSADPSFRHLARISTRYPGSACEIDTYAVCDGAPRWWLTAPGEYAAPVMVCDVHAALEEFDHGTHFPREMAR